MLIVFSTQIWASCSELTAQCLSILEGLETEESCVVSVCSNTTSHQVYVNLENGGTASVQTDNITSKVTVDEQEGIVLPHTVVKENLTCYTSTNNTKIYCVKNILL
jgi:hypothetical protein